MERKRVKFEEGGGKREIWDCACIVSVVSRCVGGREKGGKDIQFDGQS